MISRCVRYLRQQLGRHGIDRRCSGAGRYALGDWLLPVLFSYNPSNSTTTNFARRSHDVAVRPLAPSPWTSSHRSAGHRRATIGPRPRFDPAGGRGSAIRSRPRPANAAKRWNFPA